MNLLLAVALCTGIALSGWRARALTGSGAVAAVLVGSAVLHGTGWTGMAALGAFFFGASLISRLAPDRTSAFDDKGNIRDPWQVMANGGAAALGAFVPGAGVWIVTAALAAASSDTWATATGGWSRGWPRDIVTLRPVPPGTSGGVSLMGTTGAAVGAAAVGAAAALSSGQAALFPLALVVGMLGMLADSVLGTVVQGHFYCDVCDLPTERRVHRCGRPSRSTGGIAWFNNDAINALSTLASALTGFLAWRHWQG